MEDPVVLAAPARGRAIRRTVLALLLTAGAAAHGAQNPAPPPAPELVHPQYNVPRATSEIKVDGRIDEVAWQSALVLHLDRELQPKTNAPAPVATTVYLAYDHKYLYAAFRAEDPDPKQIRARLTDRDAATDDDFVGLGLDTFNDERRGFLFFVNPLGVQMDRTRTEIGATQEDDAWDAIWSSAGRIDGQGYTVEIAIPFTSLRFQRSAGDQTWGVMPYRSYPRSERHELVAVETDPDNKCLFCQSPKMTGFAGATPGRNLELDPTVTALRTEARERRGGPLEEQESTVDPGLTARWGITPNLVLSGTINPDFSQVEADVAQLDINTQFALFYPEKRPFFLEGDDFFDTPFDAVHTRIVADPSWGLKLTGKEGKNGIGVFVAQDDQTNLLVPASQFSRSTSIAGESTDAALRYRRDIGKGSTVGGLFTEREGDGYSSRLAGVDTVYRFSAADRVTAHYLDSRTEYPDAFAEQLGQPRGAFDGQAWRLAYVHNSRNWRWYGRKDEVDSTFRADLGFMPRVGYSVDILGLEHTWWGKSEDWWTRITAGSDWDATKEKDGGLLLEEELEYWLEFYGPLQSSLRYDGGNRKQYWDGVEYHEQFHSLEASVTPNGSFSFGLYALVSDAIDFDNSRPADEIEIAPSVSVNLGDHLQLFLNHDFQRLDVEGGRLYDANLSQLRAIYQLNIRTFVRAIFQYTDIQRDPDLYTFAVNEQDKDLFTQLLFSYKLNPQTVLFLGYSDIALGDQSVALTRQNRTLFFKVGYAWVL